jgi:hypothetical protein
MHVIERTDSFTLVGADARRGKLTLFEADGPREAGVLWRVVLRVSDLERAVAALPEDSELGRVQGVVEFDAPEGLRLGLTEADGELDYDIDHVILAVPRPQRASEQFAELGFDRRDGCLAVADKHLRLVRGDDVGRERPLLNHVALLVDSAEAVRQEAERRGVEVADFVDAPNTLAVFVWGPDRIKLEYVEHKPGFSLV